MKTEYADTDIHIGIIYIHTFTHPFQWGLLEVLYPLQIYDVTCWPTRISTRELGYKTLDILLWRSMYSWIWRFLEMVVPPNHLFEWLLSIINQPFWDPPFMETPMLKNHGFLMVNDVYWRYGLKIVGCWWPFSMISGYWW